MNLIDLDALIQSSYELEPIPSSLARLASLITKDESDMDEIEHVVALDPALTGRVLRAANSAAFAPGTPIATARAAIIRLGTGTVLSLALSARVSRRLQRAVPEYGLEPGQLFRHSVASALAAEVLPTVCLRPIPPETLAAALLHDIGKLVLCRSLTEPVAALLGRAYRQGWRSLREAESELLGVHHGEVGGLIARHWKLPESIALGITHHHTPGAPDLSGALAAPEGSDLTIACAVQLADEIGKAAAPTAATERPDFAALARAMDRLGLSTAGFASCCDAVRARLPAVEALYR